MEAGESGGRVKCVYCVQRRRKLCPGHGCECVRTVSPRTVSRGTGDTVTLHGSGDTILAAAPGTVAGHRAGTRFRGAE